MGSDLKRRCIEFKYYADAIHSGLTETGISATICASVAFGPASIRLIVFNKIDKMDSNCFFFEIRLVVIEAIRERCASFMILTATVPEIFGGQTNSYTLLKIIKGTHVRNVISGLPYMLRVMHAVW